MEREFAGQIFEKYSNIKFPENPSSGNRVVPCRRTDREDEANIRFWKISQTRLKTVNTSLFLVNFTANMFRH